MVNKEVMKSQIEIKIRGYHVDFYNHVNNARYMEFLEEGRWDFLSNFLDTELGVKNNRQIVVVNINMNYKGPAMLGSVMIVETSLKEIGLKSFTLMQKCFIKEKDVEIADALVKMVVVDIKLNKTVIIDDRLKKLISEMSYSGTFKK